MRVRRYVTILTIRKVDCIVTGEQSGGEQLLNKILYALNPLWIDAFYGCKVSAACCGGLLRESNRPEKLECVGAR